MLHRIRKFPVHAIPALALAIALFPAGTMFGTTAAHASPGKVVGYSGYAFGTQAFVAGGAVTLGPSFPVSICATQVGALNQNTGVGVNAPPLLVTGTILNTTSTIAVASGTGSSTTSDTQTANVLSGLITTDDVKAVSVTSQDATGTHTSAAGSSFLNLVVAGQAVSGTPGPNTTINLPGIGYVILNQQSVTSSATVTTFTVNMIHVVVTVPNPLAPVGTNIIVAHAFSALAPAIPGTLDGFAYGTRATAANGTIVSGPSAMVFMDCLGNTLRTNSVVSVNAPPLFTSGTVTNTAQGTVGPTASSAETTSTVQTVNVVAGLVTADVVRADAHSSAHGSSFTFNDDSSTFVNLVVAGHPEISGNPGPNTQVQLAGLGTLWLHRVISTTNMIEVRMIEVVVTQTNVFGIPVGTDIRVAVAEASVH
jgi:hypothetical protein